MTLDLDALRNDWTIYTTATDMREHTVVDALESLVDAVPDLIDAIDRVRALRDSYAASVRTTPAGWIRYSSAVRDLDRTLATP